MFCNKLLVPKLLSNLPTIYLFTIYIIILISEMHQPYQFSCIWKSFCIKFFFFFLVWICTSNLCKSLQKCWTFCLVMKLWIYLETNWWTLQLLKWNIKVSIHLGKVSKSFHRVRYGYGSISYKLGGGYNLIFINLGGGQVKYLSSLGGVRSLVINICKNSGFWINF